jgi:hypothetical protein
MGGSFDPPIFFMMILNQLAKTDYARIEFHLEFQESFTLHREMVLRLRREFIRIARQMKHNDQDPEQFLAMLDPGLSSDPFARRLFQKPAPPFVIHPQRKNESELDAGDQFVLEAVFLGGFARHVHLFSVLLVELGKVGFCRGEGRFELVKVTALDQAGNCSENLVINDQLTLPQVNIGWSIEEIVQSSNNIGITFLTPARLLSNSKPIFDVNFTGIFPFMLRRVSSMLYAWCGVELLVDAPGLIDAATKVDLLFSDLHWHDWRTLDSDNDQQSLGGVIGHLVLDHIDSDEILTIIALSRLLNIGKSASYGCGHFEIDISD